MIAIPISKLKSAATVKPQGYYEACLAAGTVVGENLQLTERAFAELRSRFSPPPRSRQIQTFAKAVVTECGAALAGDASVDEAEKARRIALCEACDCFIAGDRRCQKCGCWMDTKSGFRTAVCPEGKW